MMRTALWVLAVLATLNASGAQACRCQPIPLADYFAQADEVVLARLAGIDETRGGRDLRWTLEPLAPHHKPLRQRRPADRVTYVTAASSAACGLGADVGASYVLFAHHRTESGDDLPRIDSCHGSRILIDSKGQAGDGFMDVPARYLVQQLNGLAGANVLARIAAADSEVDDQDRLIGLLELKTLAHGGAVSVRRQPSGEAGLLLMAQSNQLFVSREFAYEQVGAVVYARRDGWSRVRLQDGRFGWVSPAESGTFFPYAELPLRRLSYLTAAWSGLVWPDLGAGLPQRHIPGPHADQRGQFPVAIDRSAELAGDTWFHVTLLASDGCDGRTRKPLGGGWVPAYGMDGQPNAWFYARGC